MALSENDLFLLAVLSPFIAAAIAPVLTKLFGHRAGWLLALFPAGIFLLIGSYSDVIAGGSKLIFGREWVPAYGVRFSFYLDGLSYLFALLISGIGTLIVIYSGGYLKGHRYHGRFFSYILLFMGSMLGVVLADNLITLFIYWELTSITSFLLIGFDNNREASRRAALQALLVTGAGGLSLLAGFLLISTSGITEMSQLLATGDTLKGHPYYLPVLLLVLGGAFTKSAQFPLHFWLPNAMEAPTPVSAYLHSATMVKAGVYLLMRMHPVLGDTELWSTILPLFGGATLLVGTFLAIRQTDLKLMLAYTTVASLGLLVMLTGLSVEKAIEGAVLYLFAHSLFKGALFMVAGIIDHETGTRDVTKLGGLRGAMPITFVAAVLAACSMSGLIPFIGFIAKEVLYEGTWGGETIHYVVTATAVLGNSLMLVIAAAIAIRPFFGEKVETPKHAHEGPVSLWLGPVTLAVLGLLAAFLTHETGKYLIGPMTSAITNHAVAVDLHLLPKHFISAPFILSLTTFGLGFAIFLVLDRARGAMDGLLKAIGWGPDQGFDQFVRAILRFSVVVTRVIQPGRMQVYMLMTFTVTAVGLLLPLFLFGDMPKWPDWPELTVKNFYEWCVIAIAICGLIAILVSRSRVIAIVSLGIQGFAVALLFLLFGAPDLSFTQFMVETLSVVILALVMTRLDLTKAYRRSGPAIIRDGAIAIAVGVGFALLLLSITQWPFDSRLSDFFAENSRVIAHGRNIVNVIIVDFRGLDTLGEIGVVMVTGLSILALIRIRTRPHHDEKQEHPEPVPAIRSDVGGKGGAA